jgi:hypothetical protein
VTEDPRDAAVRAELAALPVPEVPDDVAARWSAALAAAGAPAAAPPRPVPWRRLAAAAVLVAVALGTAVAGSAGPEPPVAVARVGLAAAARDAVGVSRDLGALADPAARAACLAAVGVPAGPLVGGRRVVLDGRPGVLVVLATGTRGVLRIVVVDPACTALLAQVVAG